MSAKVSRTTEAVPKRAKSPKAVEEVPKTVEAPEAPKEKVKKLTKTVTETKETKPKAKVVKKVVPLPEPVEVEEPSEEPTEEPVEEKAVPKKRAAKSPSAKAKSPSAKAKSPSAKAKPKAKKAKTAEPKKARAKSSTKAAPETTEEATESKKKTENEEKATTKRHHNLKQPALMKNGIGTGTARVKSVLMHIALNPLEYRVRKALQPVRTKSEDGTETVTEPQPLNKLPTEYQDLIAHAEKSYETSLREAYERQKVGSHKKSESEDKFNVASMSEETRKDYLAKKKAAVDQHAKTNKENNSSTPFDLHKFNLSFDKNFYNQWPAFKEANDNYIVGKVYADKNSEEPGKVKYNQWTRASALVNKLCTRVSSKTRNIIACFLDRIVEQYAANGIHNCFQEKRRIIQLRHALTEGTDGFEQRVPLHNLVQTLPAYRRAMSWIDAKLEAKEAKKTKDSEESEDTEDNLNFDPPTKYAYDFDSYASEICRSVKIQLAEQETDPALKEQYINASVSREFKEFCSQVIYETILRIGAALKIDVESSGVKTISDEIVVKVLKLLHSNCGVDFATSWNIMQDKLSQYETTRAQYKNTRKTARLERSATKTEEPDVPAQAMEVEYDDDD